MSEEINSNNLKNLSNLSVRTYLDQTVVPILLKSLVEVTNER